MRLPLGKAVSQHKCVNLRSLLMPDVQRSIEQPRHPTNLKTVERFGLILKYKRFVIACIGSIYPVLWDYERHSKITCRTKIQNPLTLRHDFNN